MQERAPIKISLQFMQLVGHLRGHLVGPFGLKIGAEHFKGL